MGEADCLLTPTIECKIGERGHQESVDLQGLVNMHDFREDYAILNVKLRDNGSDNKCQ